MEDAPGRSGKVMSNTQVSIMLCTLLAAAAAVTSCPCCFHMLSDAIKTMNLEKEIRRVDLVSHVTGG